MYLSLSLLSQGISFLDGMRKVWYDRHWNKGEQHKDFRIEILKWLKLLLSVVKITDPNAPPLLKKFLGFNRNSVIIDPEFRKSITDQILADTRNNFYILSIQQFFILYKSFRIWTLNVSKINFILFIIVITMLFIMCIIHVQYTVYCTNSIVDIKLLLLLQGGA